jgi:putative membrane protein
MSSIDPRTALAAERTRLANFRTERALDRTTLAWIRTTLTMATFGFGLAGFFRTRLVQSPTPEAIRLHHGAVQFGTALLLIGTIATALAGWSHWRSLRRLERGEPLALVRWPLSITLAFLLTLCFAVGLWTLFVR